MYPNQLINFCLDARNITDKAPDIFTNMFINIDGVIIRQNPDTLLPYLSRMLINQKDEIKKEYKATKDVVVLNKYNAIKGLVNSLYGVMAFPSFRMFNPIIASRITFLARDLLQYVESAMNRLGYKVIYTDTDALLYQADKDEIELINKLVVDWAIEKYDKPDINIQFESEGKFNKILILGKCHYYGYLEGKKDPEIKGMAIKRSSSSKYEAKFMKELVNKILDEVPKADVLAWVDSEKANIQLVPLPELAFPCKIANRSYKNETIFIRAYAYTQAMAPKAKLNKGELFHYVFVKDLGKDEKKRKINVLMLTDEIKDLPKYIDWEEMVRRNISMKADSIFELLGWKEVDNAVSCCI
jgi:DNA polymerase elongation subunit (family B)